MGLRRLGPLILGAQTFASLLRMHLRRYGAGDMGGELMLNIGRRRLRSPSVGAL